VFAGGTVYAGLVALRPAISNWRTTVADLDLFVEVIASWTPPPPRPGDWQPATSKALGALVAGQCRTCAKVRSRGRCRGWGR
jgi:hypothetical protein